MKKDNSKFVEINDNSIDESHLEPYIGHKFSLIKRGIKVSCIDWYGTKKKVDNCYINFL